MQLYVNGVFSLTDVKYEVLSLGCRKGDLECVKMMINKYDCDLKGLAYIYQYLLPPHTCMILVVCKLIYCVIASSIEVDFLEIPKGKHQYSLGSHHFIH